MRLQRTGPTLPTDCIPEEYTPLEQDFWAMRYLADELRWYFGPVVQRITRFDDGVRAYWYRVEMEPDVLKAPLGKRPHQAVGKGGGNNYRSQHLGDRCHWPRYKTLDVPVEHWKHWGEAAEVAVRMWSIVRILKEGGME